MVAGLGKLRNINMLSTVLRMSLSFLMGAAVGMERSYKNAVAGVRTHILVCLGATVASMTGIYLYLVEGLPTDISRLGAQVVSGLGFIGAGTIIVTKNYKVKGLTTAAGLWTTGIIGLSIGAGFYEGAVAAVVLVLITETLFAVLAKKIKYTPEFKIALRYYHKPAVDQVLRYCKDKRLMITNLQVVSNSDTEPKVYLAVITLHPRHTINTELLTEHIKSIHGVFSVEDDAGLE